MLAKNSQSNEAVQSSGRSATTSRVGSRRQSRVRDLEREAREQSVLGSGAAASSYNPFPRSQLTQGGSTTHPALPAHLQQPQVQAHLLQMQGKSRSRVPSGMPTDLETPGPGSYQLPDPWAKKSFSVSSSMGQPHVSRQSKFFCLDSSPE